MSITLYASFSHPVLAERAAGALLDHGVLSEHISLVRKNDETFEATPPSEGAAIHSPFTSGAVVPGAGTVPASGSAGIQPGANQTSMSSPPSTAFGNPSPGYDEAEIDSTRRGQGFVDDNGSGASNDALSAMRDKDLADGADAPPYPSGVASGGVGYVPVGADGEPVSMEADADRRSDPEETAKHGLTTTTGADAGSAAIKGTGVGIGVGILAGLTSLLVPGIGIVVGGGALAIALGGLAASAGAGAIAGGVFGYLKDQGMEEHVAREYSGTVERGGALLAVQCPSGSVSEDEMRQVLDKYGAVTVGYVGSRGYVA